MKNGFANIFIQIISDLYVHESCHQEWISIIIATRWAMVISSEFRDAFVNSRVIEVIVPYCKHYMFSVSLLVASLFPPGSDDIFVDSLRQVLQVFQVFINFNNESRINFVLSSLQSVPFEKVKFTDLIIDNELMDDLECLREVPNIKIARSAMKIVNKINATAMLHGVMDIFDCE